MSHVLVLFAHPRADRSEVNTHLARVARETPGVTLVDLYAEYPRFDIDVDAEQRRLVEHDVIVFQHPVYWYSSPALLKEWQDLVLEYGFAYGTEGTALRGKTLISVVSAGAPSHVYTEQGSYNMSLRRFFAPFEYTAQLCGMRYLSPFVLFGAGHSVEEGRLGPHLERYRQLLEALVEERLDLDLAERVDCLATHLGGETSGGIQGSGGMR
ncbi:General stress protein 14 [Planctomycetes bacterium Poly30]|uniref:General stress protein 14 n=1 Tax=Saltatorellus ferox TaxID=2528018 RepID=A0A518EQQ6_9BACT|nr:General stress protein 14 [Planctomycetes bacterium Poly30]